MSLRRRVAALSVWLMSGLLAHPASAQLVSTMAGTTGNTERADASTGKRPLPSKRYPLGGEVRMSASAGAGTFVPGESNRSTLDMLLGYRVAYAAPKGVTLSASGSVSKNLVASADSGLVRPHDTIFGDVVVAAGWGPRITNAEGKEERFKLPGAIVPSLSLSYAIPNSRGSQFAGRVGSVGFGASLAKPDLFGHLSLSYGFGFQKFLLTRTQGAVQTSDFPTLARPSSTEALGSETLVAANTLSLLLRHSFSAGWTVNDRLSLGLTFVIMNRYVAFCPEPDALTSIYASGRCGGDGQLGVISAGYSLDAEGLYSLSAYLVTSSTGRTADTHGWRFPFFDFRSTADNYSSVGLELQRSF